MHVMMTSIILFNFESEYNPLAKDMDRNHGCILQFLASRFSFSFKGRPRPCLVPKKFCKIFQISGHIESCGTYMKH